MKIKSIYFFYIVTFIFRLFFATQVGLADDEAYHWSWAKELQLSYFDHPGFIAWCEALSTALFGDTFFGVRLPAMIFYGLTAFWSWKLTKDLFNEQAAHWVVLIFLWSPFYGFGGHVASPEPPFIFFWILSSWIFWQGVREDEHRWSLSKTWIYLGLSMGLGINSKFIISLLAPGFALFMLFHPKHRKDFLTPWPWLGAGVATLMSLPVFYWNYIHDWPSFKYQFHDRHTHTAFSFLRWLEFLGAQLIFYSPFLYVLILFIFIYSYFKKSQSRWLFIFALSAPSFFVFYPQPFTAEFKPHWTGAAVLILIMGVAGALNLGIIRYRRFWNLSIALFYVLFSFITYAPFIYPWLPKAYRLISSEPWSPRNDLSNEF
ncbi:MAG TPA: glycosyltransferase family 39 protein, partial [Pseudobdellovibrionaceae bacterium]|nr:glycosyltransferase family 39 protein [Pseudobdellovibrionaceae bacterium]